MVTLRGPPSGRPVWFSTFSVSDMAVFVGRNRVMKKVDASIEGDQGRSISQRTQGGHAGALRKPAQVGTPSQPRPCWASFMASAIQARKRGVRSWLLILLALNKIAIRLA